MESIKIEVEKIMPVGKRLILSIFEGSRKTESGLEITVSEGGATPVLGEVIQATKDSEYKKGDLVFFRRYSIDEVKVDAATDSKFYFLEESEIIGTYEVEVKSNNE